MDDENKKVVVEETTEVTDPVTKTTTDTDTGIDYAAELASELEKTKKRLDQAEHTIISLKKKPKEEVEEDEDEEEKKDFTGEIEKIRNENKTELEKIRLDLVKDTVSDTLNSLTTNPDERALIQFNYENRIVKSGFDKQSILEDLNSARLLANRAKLEKTITELKYTLDSEVGKNKGGSAAGHNMDKKTSLTESEEAWVRQHAARTKTSEEVVRAKLIANKS